jgi:hypothetical protein
MAFSRIRQQGALVISQAVSQAPEDMPPWIAKLLDIEANFLPLIWGAIKRPLGKR